MFGRIRIILWVFAWLSLLAACSAAPTVESVTPLPSATVVVAAFTPAANPGTQTNIGFDCQNVQEIPVEECQALVALYKRTDGDHWADNSAWLTTNSPCTWYGVICDQGHMMELQLDYNKLKGSLPPELGQLASLRVLHLSHNQLEGPIPPALGGLTNLNQLDLSFNRLDRSIPSELEKLTGLYELDLSYNQLTGSVPTKLTKAPISDLRLWGNALDNTIPISEGTRTTVEYRGVKFEFDSSLAESVWPEVGAALPPPENGEFDWETRPERFRFTFANQSKPDRFDGGGIGISGFPQIIIYPTESFRKMSEMAGERIDGLQALLDARPSSPQGEIPLLPLTNAAQVFHVQLAYLDFQNGRGVRFITHYSQENVGRVTKKNIFYTFQGLTQDGDYYVTAYFPISVASLRDKPVDEDYEAAQARLAEDIRHLDSLSANEFEPDLDKLDAVIQSLVVTPH